MNHEVSLAHLTLAEARPVELIEAAAAGGFDSVSLCLAPSKADQIFYPVVGDAAEIRRIRSALAATGLSILDAECIWLTPERRARDYEAMLATAGELGARFALVIGNDPDAGRLREEFATLCEIASPYGLTMMLEFIPYLTVNTVPAALSVLAAARHGNRGLMVDALHVSRSGTPIGEIAALDPALLQYCQICDAPAARPPADQLRTEAREGRLYPGEGALPLVELLRALPDCIPLSVEAPARSHAHRPLAERASLARQGVRALLERVAG